MPWPAGYIARSGFGQWLTSCCQLLLARRYSHFGAMLQPLEVLNVRLTFLQVDAFSP